VEGDRSYRPRQDEVDAAAAAIVEVMRHVDKDVPVVSVGREFALRLRALSVPLVRDTDEGSD